MSISVSNLRLSRADRVLVNDLTFNVPDGSIVAIVGGNGSGKSTLVAALAGDLIPEKGQVRLDGDLLSDLSDAEQARRRSVLTQQPPLLPYTPWDLIDLAAPGLGDRGVEEMLERFALVNLARRQLLTLSGGERGRALLAATVSRARTTLLLDEPTAAFDREFRGRFVGWLEQWRTAGHAIVVVAHDAEVEALADQVIALD